VSETVNKTMKAYEEMQEKLRPLVEALRFYATKESWKYLGPMYGRTLIEDADLEQLPLDDRVTERTTSTGGKRAREALKGWEG